MANIETEKSEMVSAGTVDVKKEDLGTVDERMVYISTMWLHSLIHV